MIVIRQRLYAESDEEQQPKQKNKHTGLKVALGTTAAAATFAAARRGLLGKRAQFGTNKAWINLGKEVESNRMVHSGTRQMGNVAAKLAKKDKDPWVVKNMYQIKGNVIRSIDHDLAYSPYERFNHNYGSFRERVVDHRGLLYT